jgi:hypothetical protein
MYIASLRALSLPTEPYTSYLLLHLMLWNEKLTDFSRLMQYYFFSDCFDLATSILNIIDIISAKINSKSSKVISQQENGDVTAKPSDSLLMSLSKTLTLLRQVLRVLSLLIVFQDFKLFFLFSHIFRRL